MFFPRLIAAMIACAAACPQVMAGAAVSFKKDLAGLLQRRCVACHGEESAKGGYRLDTFARLGNAGDSGFLCDLPEMALSVAFHPDGNQLAAGSGDRTIRFFDVEKRRQTRVLRPHADWVQSIAYSADGTHLLSTSRDRTVRVASTAAGEIEATYTGHETATLTAIFSRDGKTAFSLAQASPLHFWDPASGKSRAEKPFTIPGRPDRLAWLGNDLVAAGADGLVRFYQPADQQLTRTLYGHREGITSLAISRVPGVFATGSYDGTVCVWNSACETWAQRFIASPR